MTKTFEIDHAYNRAIIANMQYLIDHNINSFEEWTSVMLDLHDSNLNVVEYEKLFIVSPRSNNLDIVRHLYETYISDVDIMHDINQTALHVAVSYNCDLDIIKFLLKEAGANPRIINYENKTAFTIAANNRNKNILELLIKY